MDFIIKTGITNIDKILCDNTKSGYLIEIAGKKGSGKTQLSFLICAVSGVNNKKIIYAGASGNFRPERIKVMMDKILIDNNETKIYLKNIIYQRIYEFDDLAKLVKKIKIINFDILILDDIIPLFLYKFKENTRLEVRNLIRELSMISLSKKIIVLFTNMVIEKVNKDGKGTFLHELFFHDIVRYVHFKFFLKNHHSNKQVIECKLIYPYNKKNSKTDLDLGKY